jgi:hypothetical protein
MAKKLPSRRYDAVIKLWRSRLNDPAVTTDEKVEAARQLQAILLHQDKVLAQRQYTELSNPVIPTDPEALQKTIEQLKRQAQGGA